MAISLKRTSPWNTSTGQFNVFCSPQRWLTEMMFDLPPDRWPSSWLAPGPFPIAHCLHMRHVFKHGGAGPALDAGQEAISIEMGPGDLQWIPSGSVRLHVLRVPRQRLFGRIQLVLPTRRFHSQSSLAQGNSNDSHRPIFLDPRLFRFGYFCSALT